MYLSVEATDNAGDYAWIYGKFLYLPLNFNCSKKYNLGEKNWASKKASFYKRICKKQNFYSLHQLPPPSFQEIYGESNLRSKLTNFSRQQKSILIKNEALSRVKGYVNYISIKKRVKNP